MAKPKSRKAKPRGEQQIVDLDYLVRKVTKGNPKLEAIVELSPDAGKVYDPDTKIIDLSKLRVNRIYQRLTNVALVKRIVNKFSENAGMMILVARRKGDSEDVYYIIEGQQRATSLRARGYKAARCIVIDLSDVIEEARTFIAINKERRAVSPAKQFQVEVLSGDNESATLLNQAVERAGVVFHEHDGNRRVKAPTKLSQISVNYSNDVEMRGSREYVVPNYNAVTCALGAYNTIWKEHKSVHTGLVAGLACLQFAAVERSGDLLKATVSSDSLATTIGSVLLTEDMGLDSGAIRDANKKKGALADMEYAHILVLAHNRNAVALGKKKLPDALIFASAKSSTPQKYLKHLS